jgi:hypothetical protein
MQQPTLGKTVAPNKETATGTSLLHGRAAEITTLRTLELGIKDGAAVAFKLWSTANQWETRSTWLAAHFTIQAAAANLPGATTRVDILQVGDSKI